MEPRRAPRNSPAISCLLGEDFIQVEEWNADDADAADFRGLSLEQIRENPLHPRHPRSILVAATAALCSAVLSVVSFHKFK